MRRVLIASVLTTGVALTLVIAQDAPPPAAPAPTPLAPPAGLPMSDSVKIVIENKAKSAGEIRFTFTPAGGQPTAIRVTVAKKMKNADVARDLAKELTVALGPDYKVDHYDPDKIKVSAKKKGATFRLSLAELTANGLSVRLK